MAAVRVMVGPKLMSRQRLTKALPVFVMARTVCVFVSVMAAVTVPCLCTDERNFKGNCRCSFSGFGERGRPLGIGLLVFHFGFCVNRLDVECIINHYLNHVLMLIL